MSIYLLALDKVGANRIEVSEDGAVVSLYWDKTLVHSAPARGQFSRRWAVEADGIEEAQVKIAGILSASPSVATEDLQPLRKPLESSEEAELRALIQDMHNHYNPNSGAFDIEAALESMRQLAKMEKK